MEIKGCDHRRAGWQLTADRGQNFRIGLGHPFGHAGTMQMYQDTVNLAGVGKYI